MAYNCSYTHNYSDAADFFTAVGSGIEACGWELHDTVSATVKVYRTNGEDNQFAYGYFHITQGSTYLTLRCYQYWDEASNTGRCEGYYNATYNRLYWTVNTPLMVYGDRNHLVIFSSGYTTNYSKTRRVGHIPYIYDTTTGILAVNATSGSDVTLTVSGIDYVEDSNYMITGEGLSEGRDRIKVKQGGITISGTITYMTIDNLPRNYDAGAIIAVQPNTFGTHAYNSPSNRHFPVCNNDCVGTAIAPGNYNQSGYDATTFLTVSYCDPDVISNRWILQPVKWAGNLTLDYEPIGYGIGDNILYAPVTGHSSTYLNDMYAIGSYETCTATEDAATPNEIKDDTKSWTTNEHVGKICLIAEGTSLGQSRVIQSNTSDTLYFAVAWYEDPDTDDIFRIVDGEVWRILDFIACKEVI